MFTLTEAELQTLERALCSQDEPDFLGSTSNSSKSKSGKSSSAGCLSLPSSTHSTSTTAVQTEPSLMVKPSHSASCSSDELSSLADHRHRPQRKPRKIDKAMKEIVCQAGSQRLQDCGASVASTSISEGGSLILTHYLYYHNK